MRKIREILRLRHECGMSHGQIARAVKTSVGSVYNTVTKAEKAGIGWPLDIDEEGLERALYGGAVEHKPVGSFQMPDFSYIHAELQRKGVTLTLLWEEYKGEHGERAYQFTQFCHHYNRWRGKLNLSMRQVHKAGERMFLDYAGQTVPINTPEGVRAAQIFVATLGASNYTYFEATWSQTTHDWIMSHVRAFEFFGGVTELLVPDNLKSGVIKASLYDPTINRAYADLSEFYSTAVLPARPRRPRDKGKVESGVQVTERWVLARLRNREFTSLSDLNRELRLMHDYLNDRPFKRLAGSRKSRFEEIERAALKPLPATRFEYAERPVQRVPPDYHVEHDNHHYSVPSHLARQKVDLRITARTLEIFHRGVRVASHQRVYSEGTSTHPEHMPEAHRIMREWSIERARDWANDLGPSTRELVEQIISAAPHGEVAKRTLLGIHRLEKSYGRERLDAACHRALSIGAYNRKSLESILKRGLDQKRVEERARLFTAEHENIRGADYYNYDIIH